MGLQLRVPRTPDTVIMPGDDSAFDALVEQARKKAGSSSGS